MADKPVDYVNFILGEKKNNSWRFKLRWGYVRTFQYEGNIPFLSGTEIGLRIISNWIDQKFLEGEALHLSKVFYERFIGE